MSALRSWLAVRYNRAAFPDPFVNRLSEFKVDKRLAKIIEPVGNLLSAVYFDVDDGNEVDHSDGSPYDLKIVLAYPPGDDPDQTADEVEKIETAITTLFIDPAVFNLKYWMVPPYRDDGNHRYEKTDTGSPV